MLSRHEIEQADHYLTMAQQAAEKYSHDPKTKVGCVIVAQSVIAVGVNKFPSGMAVVPDATTDEKHKYIIHAEQDAILSLVGKHIPAPISTAVLYVTHAPCSVCARLIAATGIRKVVFRYVHKGSDLQTLSDLGISFRRFSETS